MLAAGVHAVYGEPLADVGPLVRSLVDARWPWQPQLLRARSIPGGPPTPQATGKIPRARLAEAVARALKAPTTESISLAASRLERSCHTWATVETGRGRVGRGRCPLTLDAFTRLEKLPAGKSGAAWVELVHELVRAVQACHAVIVVAPELVVHVETSLTTMSIGDRPVHPDEGEIRRIGRARERLGPERVRPPRWGNYLGPAHVAAAGGRARIAAVVAPPVMVDVGPLLYVQVSMSPYDALAPEAEARRRALAELLRGVTV